MRGFIKKKANMLVLLAIFIIGLFFRLYNFEASFLFGHDHDLYSWIARDLLVNKHWRLVGQVTSVPGVFIGPLYYYLMAFFYFLFRMNPLGAIVPLTAMGLAGIFSFYFLIKTYFDEKTGVIGAFLWACTWGIASFERWSVPTEPTLLWSVWFLYLNLGMLKGKVNKLLPLYALLTGLTYHIHIALLPVIILPPISYLLSEGKLKDKFLKIDIKKMIVAAIIFLLVSSPFWVFEIKYGFSQSKSALAVGKIETGEPTGWLKLKKVVEASGKEFQVRLANGLDGLESQLAWLFFLVSAGILIKAKKINGKQLLIVGGWIWLILLAQYISKRKVSEYYFTNLVPILMLFFSLLLKIIYEKFGRKILVCFLFVWLLLNTKRIVSGSLVSDSYLYKKQLVEFIAKEATEHKYPCVAINYIADFGTGVGYRYLFWYKGIDLVKPGSGAPIYNIVVPYFTSESEVVAKFGSLGVILPEKEQFDDFELCDKKENQIDPLLGYTE